MLGPVEVDGPGYVVARGSATETNLVLYDAGRIQVDILLAPAGRWRAPRSASGSELHEGCRKISAVGPACAGAATPRLPDPGKLRSHAHYPQESRSANAASAGARSIPPISATRTHRTSSCSIASGSPSISTSTNTISNDDAGSRRR